MPARWRPDMRYRVRHETAYAYGSDVVHSHQLLHLVPRPSPFQECADHSIEISPINYHRRDEMDAFGNIATRIEIESPHRQLDVSAEMEVEVHARPQCAAADTDRWEDVRSNLSYKSGRWPSREVLEAVALPARIAVYPREAGVRSITARSVSRRGRPCSRARKR